MNTRRFICSSSIAALVLTVAAAPRARAIDQVWQNSGSSDVWDTVTVDNWIPGPFGSGDNAFFGGTGETVDVSGFFTVGNINFSTTGYVIADADLDGFVSLADAAVITQAQIGASTTVISAPLTTGSFTVTRAAGTSGNATLELSGSNLINGTLTLASIAGANNTVRLGSSASTSSTTIVNVTGPSGSTVEFLLNGFNTTIGGLTNAGAGTRRFRNGSATSATVTIDAAAGAIYNFGSQVGSSAASSQNGNRFGVTKTGGGLQEFSNASAQTATQAAGVGYFGDTIIQGGALGFAPIGGLVNGATSSLIVLDGGVLQSTAAGIFNRSLGFTPGAYLLANPNFQMTANGGGFSARGGKLTVNIGGAGATLDWGTNVGSELVGPLKFGHASSNNEVEFVNPIRLNGTERTFDGTDNTGSANDFATLSGAITDGTGSAGIVKTGTGVVVLAGANTYSGGTRIEGGTLGFTPGSLPATSPITLSGSGALRWSGVNSVDLSARIKIEDFATGTIDTAGNDVVFATPLQTGFFGSGALGKAGAGSLTLTTANTFTGGAVLTGGALLAANDLSLGTGPITLSGGTLASSSTASRTFANPLTVTTASGFGDLVKTGEITMTGPGNFNGAPRNLTFLSETTFAGPISNGGLGQKLGPGLLTITGDGDSLTTDMDWSLGGVIEVREGTLIIDGANIVNRDALRVMANNAPGATALFEIKNGGSFSAAVITANLRIGHEAATVTDGINIANIAGEITLPTGGGGGFVQMGSRSALAQLNLQTGGRLSTKGVTISGLGNGALANTELNFDGGTLQATESNAAFISNLTTTNIASGGGTIDSNGFDIAIPQALLHLPALGATPDGGLTKAGFGTLTLHGPNTYTGGTRLAGGTLAFDTGSLGASGAVTFTADSTLRWNGLNSQDLSTRIKINDGVTASLDTNGNNVLLSSALQVGAGATGALTKVGLGTLTLDGANTFTGTTSVNEGRLNVTGPLSSNITVADGAALGGEGAITGTITLGSASGANIFFDATTPGVLSSTGAITLNGVNFVNVVNPATGSGLKVLQSAVPIVGTAANVQLANAGDFRAGTGLSFNGAGTELLFDIVTSSVKWNGNLSAAWDNNSTFNWLNSGTPDKFYLGDAVTFDNTAAGPNLNPTIDAGIVVRPASITFDNTVANPYAISGLGMIAGQTGLTKNGAGTVTIATDNTFTGAVAINAGTLQLGDGLSSSGSAGVGPMTNNAALVLNFAGTSTVPNAISGSGTLTKNGSAVTTLSGVSSYTGVTTVNAGVLSVGSPTALGSTAAGTFVADAAGLRFAAPLLDGSTVAEPITLQGGFDQFLPDLQITDGRTDITLSGPLTIQGDTVFTADSGASLTIAGGITGGAAGISVNTFGGAGTFTFATANNYAGLTTLGGGALEAGNNASFGTGPLQLNGGALSSMDTTARTFANPLTLGGSTTLGNAMNNGALTFTGATTLITTPQLTVLSPVTLAGPIDDGGFFLGLIKGGAADLTLPGANTYLGGTNINAGRVLIGNDLSLGSGALTMNGGAIASVGLTPRTIANPVFITLASVYGDTVNSGALTFTGPVDFSGASRTLNIASNNVTFTGPQSNGGLAQKLGAGTLTYVGDNDPFTTDLSWSLGGAIEVRSGSLIFDGVNVQNRDAVRIAATGTPGTTARFEMTNGATLAFDLNGANFRVGHESSTITDAINIADIAGAVSFPAASTAGNIQLGSDSALAQVNLKAGGVITARSIGLGVQVPAGGVQEFNFDGGTLRPFVSNANFFNNVLTAAKVQAGGGTIDTNGFNITIAQNLQHDPALGATPDGGITKVGSPGTELEFAL